MTPAGSLAQLDARWTGLQTVTAPDTTHILRSDASTADESIGSTAVFNLNMIDRGVERARTLSPAIRPVRVGGKEFYVAFLHPYQVTDLRISTSTGQWLDIQKAAMTGGEIEDNPIFDGSLGM